MVPVAPLLVDNVACVAVSIATYDQTHPISFAPETADKCIPLPAMARSVILPLMYGDLALLEVRLPQDGRRGLVAEAHRACPVSGQTLTAANKAVVPTKTATEVASAGGATVPVNPRSQVALFVNQYLQ